MSRAEENPIHVYDGFATKDVSQVFAHAAYEGLAITDGEKILACNDQFLDLCPAANQTRTLEACVGFEAMRLVLNLLEKEDGDYGDVVRIRHGETWLEFRSRPVTHPHLPDGLSVLIVRDVTDVVSAHKALERAKADLEQFAYVASHDLKSPLRGINNLVTWIKEDLPDEAVDEASEYLDLLAGRVTRMETLLDDLLAFSRAGRERASLSTVRLDVFLRDIVDLLAPNPGFEVTVRAPSVSVQLTPTPLRTVVQNLVHNAFKHHDRDRGAITVDAAIDSENLQLVLNVRDDGPGIAEQFHQKVFNVFETLRPRDELEGSGIGLALVERLVRHAGGGLELESPLRDGRGTKFGVTWPLTAVSNKPDEP